MTVSIQHIDQDVSTNGSTVSITAGSATSAMFFRNTVQRRASAGVVGNTSNIDMDDLGCALEVTATNQLTVRNPIGNNNKMVGEVWRYTGAASGPDEFISRQRFTVVCPAGQATTNAGSIAGVVNRNKCIAFITGWTHSVAVSRSAALNSMAFAYINDSTELVVERTTTSSTAALTVYVDVVEFTGSNWSVHYARFGWSDGQKTLYTDSRGNAGTTGSVASWTSAHIIEGNTAADAANDALEDTTFTLEPGSSTATVQMDVDPTSANNADTFCYVLSHPNITVYRSTLSKNIPNNNTYDNLGVPAGTQLFGLEFASVEGWVHTDGTGTAYARGSLSFGLSTTSNIRTWCHRSGNTGTYRYGAVDYSLVVRPVIDTISIQSTSTDGGNITITGSNFEASQGTGTVYVSNDALFSDADRVEQTTIVSWSDTSITFTFDAGAYATEQTLYVWVLADSGENSNSVDFYYGNVTFELYLLSQNPAPDHYWTMNNTYQDEITLGTQDMNNVGGQTTNFRTTPGSAIRGSTETHSLEFDNTTGDQRTECANSNFMNGQTETVRTMGGWIYLTEVQERLLCFYEEGGNVNNIAFMLGAGNVLIAQMADTGDDNVHAYSNTRLTPGRWYHIMFRFAYGDGNIFQLILDGIEQDVTFGNPLTATDLDAHSGDIQFGRPGGSLEVFGSDITFNGATIIYKSHWYTYTRNVPTSELRSQFLFGLKSANLVDGTTEAAQQLQIDAYASTTLPVDAAGLEIRAVTPAGDVTLEFDNIQFRDDHSVHVLYIGGNTLTIKNLNGGNIDAAKCEAPYGGSIIVQTPSNLTVDGFVTGSCVAVLEAGTSNVLANLDNQTAPFNLSVEVNAVDVIVQNDDYVYVRINNVDTTSDAFVPISQELDRNDN